MAAVSGLQRVPFEMLLHSDNSSRELEVLETRFKESFRRFSGKPKVGHGLV